MVDLFTGGMIMPLMFGRCASVAGEAGWRSAAGSCSCDLDRREHVNNEHPQTISATLAITLIGFAPAWSQSLLKRFDPDNDGTVDLTEPKAAAGKLFDKLDRDHASTDVNCAAGSTARISPRPTPTTTGLWIRINLLRWSRNASRQPIPTMTHD